MVFKGFILLGLGIALGYFLGASNAHTPTAATLIPDGTKAQLEQLANVDIDEYYRLKESEAKFRKADEIFGKIVAIFLADLGLHVKSAGPVARAAVEPGKQPETAKAPAAVSAPVAAAPAPASWQANEKGLLAVRSERGIAEELERVKLPDPTATWNQALSFKNRKEQLQGLSGRFAGTGSVTTDGQEQTWDITMQVDAQMKNEKLDGIFKAILSKNGKTFSNSSSSGGIRAFKEVAGESKTVLAEISPTLMFQLYYIKDLDQLAGHVYKRSSEDDAYQHIGTFTLKRN